MTIRLLAGDCRSVLATLPDASVHCVVTSPPYYGLREYGTATWEGGDQACDHVVGEIRTGLGLAKLGERYRGGGHKQGEVGNIYAKGECPKCGAIRVDRQIGLEATPEAYLETMVAVFREVRRVLRPDGTLWLNIGDSYASGSKGTGGATPKQVRNAGSFYEARHSGMGDAKPKDLLLMPARLALALQADGWWVRSDIIWHKPNPMPESVTDRPTSAHEHVFLLTRSARYYYDADAVREEAEYGRRDLVGETQWGRVRDGDPRDDRKGGTGYTTGKHPETGRNLRNVWTIPTAPFSQSHFATFPPALVERCVKAGTSQRGCCAQCGAPWRRMTERRFTPQPDVSLARGIRLETQHDAANQWPGTPRGSTTATTTGWSASCTHDAPAVPCTILDPFFGAGTTGLVSDRLGRDAIGIDLNPDYNAMSRARITDDAPLFAAFPVVDPADERQADLWQEPVAK